MSTTEYNFCCGGAEYTYVYVSRLRYASETLCWHVIRTRRRIHVTNFEVIISSASYHIHVKTQPTAARMRNKAPVNRKRGVIQYYHLSCCAVLYCCAVPYLVGSTHKPRVCNAGLQEVPLLPYHKDANNTYIDENVIALRLCARVDRSMHALTGSMSCRERKNNPSRYSSTYIKHTSSLFEYHEPCIPTAIFTTQVAQYPPPPRALPSLITPKTTPNNQRRTRAHTTLIPYKGIMSNGAVLPVWHVVCLAASTVPKINAVVAHLLCCNTNVLAVCQV